MCYLNSDSACPVTAWRSLALTVRSCHQITHQNIKFQCSFITIDLMTECNTTCSLT